MPKMYLLLLDDSMYKKAKDVNKNVVETISHGECKYVLFNKGCLGYQAPSPRPSYPSLGPRPPKYFQPVQPPPNQSLVTLIMCTVLN